MDDTSQTVQTALTCRAYGRTKADVDKSHLHSGSRVGTRLTALHLGINERDVQRATAGEHVVEGGFLNGCLRLVEGVKLSADPGPKCGFFDLDAFKISEIIG